MKIKTIRYRILFFNLLFTIAFYGCGSNEKTKNDFLDSQSKPTIDKFFESVKSGNYKSGLLELLKSNQNISVEDSSTILLVKRFSLINDISGKFISDTLLRKNQIGEYLVVYSYLTRYENNFYRFLFTFYNNGKDVRIYKFSFDDEIPTELEESIKFYVK